MAAKQTKIKTAKVPAGFKTVAVGGAGAWHDFYKNPILQGVVKAAGSFKGQYGKQRTLTVETKKNGMASFSESKSLKELFDTPKIVGREIFVQYLGEKALKGKKRVKLFSVGIK
jgi:hypothetical protein